MKNDRKTQRKPRADRNIQCRGICFCKLFVADNIFRFAPIDLDQAQYASVHGANEHIKL